MASDEVHLHIPRIGAWSLICTIDVFIFRQVDDEVSAVASVADHVLTYGRDHLPFIHMVRTPANGWPLRGPSQVRFTGMIDRDFLIEHLEDHPNMYVPPPPNAPLPSSWVFGAPMLDEADRNA